MAVLKISVSGPPESGKTALLALIKNYLSMTGIETVCSQDRLANSPKMDGSLQSLQMAAATLSDKKTSVVLTELYETQDETLSDDHDRQRPVVKQEIDRLDPLS